MSDYHIRVNLTRPIPFVTVNSKSPVIGSQVERISTSLWREKKIKLCAWPIKELFDMAKVWRFLAAGKSLRYSS